MKTLLYFITLLNLCNFVFSTNWKKCNKVEFPKPPCCGGYDSAANKLNHFRIKGGKNTGVAEFPWIVFVVSSRGQNVFICGGSLISARWVLTAAHCIHVNLRLGIRLREWNIRTDPDCVNKVCQPHTLRIKIDKYIIHDSYDAIKIQNDIALLRLEAPITYSKFLHPICLPQNQPKALTGTTAITAGWGKYKKRKLSILLLKASMNIWSEQECGEYNDGINTSVHLCAGGKRGIAICDGDSGGPLMALHPERKKNHKIYQYLVGVTSLSYGKCGLEGSPSIFTKVAPYIKWIKKTINKYTK